MNLRNITPNQITEKFNKWLSRWICEVMRSHKNTGQVIVNKINLQERPNSIYEVKEYIIKLEKTLPEDTVAIDWFLKFRKDIKRWKSISESLLVGDFKDMRIDDMVEYMIEDIDRVEELL